MKKKKRYTKRQLQRWYKEELNEIFEELFNSFEYKTILSCPVKTLNWFRSNDSFLDLVKFLSYIGLIDKDEIGKIYGYNIEINKKKELIIKIKKLQKKK